MENSNTIAKIPPNSPHYRMRKPSYSSQSSKEGDKDNLRVALDDRRNGSTAAATKRERGKENARSNSQETESTSSGGSRSRGSDRKVLEETGYIVKGEVDMYGSRLSINIPLMKKRRSDGHFVLDPRFKIVARERWDSLSTPSKE